MMGRLRNLLGCRSDDAVFKGRPVELSRPIEPLDQNGHMCKTVALANMEAHYARRHGVQPIPLLKEHARHEREGLAVPQQSVRQLAKECGSKQGEILESGTISEIAARMGYKTNSTKPATVKEFEAFVNGSLKREAPVFACFPVDTRSHTPNHGRPTDYNGLNEHAAVIVAHDPVQHTVDMVHWGETWKAVPASVLHDKMKQLPEAREQEVYKQVGESVSNGALNRSGKPYKYDLASTPASADDEKLLKSVIPRPGTGFQNTLISLAPDPSHVRWR